MGATIALISDIHGNGLALKSVLDEIDKLPNIDHIYCLGDLLGVGHQSNHVLDLVFSREDISFVRGNHDQEIMNILKGEPNKNDLLLEHHMWIAERINPEYHKKILEFPLMLNHEYNGKRLLTTHYQTNNEGNFIASDPEPTIKKFESYYNKFNADIICFGHRHMVHYFQSEHCIYVNPGPVGIDNFRAVAKYCLLDIGEDTHVHFKEIGLDLIQYKKFIEDFITLQVPYGERLLKSGCYKLF